MTLAVRTAILSALSCATPVLADIPPTPQSFVVFHLTGGSGDAVGRGLSSNGFAVANQGTKVVRYAPGFGAQDLGSPFNSNEPGPWGVNSAGSVVGHSNFGSGVAYRYDEGVGYSVVASNNAAAYAISDSGVIGGIDGNQAFVWTAAAGVQHLGASTRQALAVNESGQAAGFGLNGISQSTAFLYSPAIGVQYIPPPGTAMSEADGINDLGQVLIGGFNNNGTTVGAFIYSPGGGFAQLPGTAGAPLQLGDLNNLGWAVGRLNSRGVLWLPGASSPLSLTSYVQTYFGGSYQVDTAVAVNDLGQIVGTVFDTAGRQSAYILTIPSPGTLVFVGFTAFAPRRRSLARSRSAPKGF